MSPLFKKLENHLKKRRQNDIIIKIDRKNDRIGRDRREVRVKLQDKFVRRQLELMNSVADNVTLATARRVQNTFGALMRFNNRHDVVINDKEKDGMRASLVVPRDELRGGVILYIHGGGYACGNLDYARGFSTMLSAEVGMRVFAPEYRLAPEHPYPAAIEDVYKAYLWLIELGYSPDRIILVGESAGGGLCYSLCIRLRETDKPMPAGIVTISPWCDLSLVGESYEDYADLDPSLTKKRLEFFTDCYLFGEKTPADKPGRHVSKKDTDKKRVPYVSPVYGDMRGLPPSLILTGEREILRSDSERMHVVLKAHGVKSTLHIKKDMWHAYLMYSLDSNREDFAKISDFIKKNMPADNERKLRWMHLDNTAKIYPASANSRWSNIYRLSATLVDDVDRDTLQSALDVTVRRFPSIAVRLCSGTFWYYLEEIAHAPAIKDEMAYPLARMPFDDIRSCAFRVLIYKKRIAVEFFHALTDGNGALVFLKTLVAEYLTQKYGIDIPAENGILDRLEPPREEELVDLFPHHCAPVGKSRRDTDSYRVLGEYEPDGFCHNTTFIMDSDELRIRAHDMGVTVTAFMAAVFIKAIINIQNAHVLNIKRQKEVKVLVPVDLRRLYGGETLRNFVLYTTPGVDPRLGEYTVEEIAGIVLRHMQLEITEKNMSAMIYTNVKDEQMTLLKLTPLFLKNIVMKTIFNLVGERKSTLSLSNLGVAKIPEVMQKYVEHFDFVLSVQSSAPYNAGMISYKGKARLNIIRNIKEPKLERALFDVLKSVGIKVKLESNRGARAERPKK